MSKLMQVYYHAVFGGIGGLLGWWIMGSFATQVWNMWLAAAFVGSGLGLCIGGLVAATDGAMIKRAPVRAVRDGLLGALGGAVLGVAGFMLAQQGFLTLQAGFAGRTLSWMILGLLVGLSDYAVRRRPQRASYAALGGLAGGFVGGLLYEALTQLFLAQSGAAQVWLSGIGLVLIGACIGGLIPLARQVFSRGELHVLAGEQAGLVREVTDTATIGRYDGNDLYLPDAGVSWRHAVVRRSTHGFELAVLPEAEHIAQIGSEDVAPGSTHLLTNGDQIRIGEALLQFVGR
ncbi:MAG: FHA domain-containing protein [Chloroflexaceae bacterium]|nr:FHA domain-containing protein [Chloroflexaceae bacterium]NJO06406.1 FHA domain-containing protein [Chloroflexaceae bacterium]